MYDNLLSSSKSPFILHLSAQIMRRLTWKQPYLPLLFFSAWHKSCVVVKECRGQWQCLPLKQLSVSFSQMPTIPGLPTRPCFYDIDLDPETEQVNGLFWVRTGTEVREGACVYKSHRVVGGHRWRWYINIALSSLCQCTVVAPLLLSPNEMWWTNDWKCLELICWCCFFVVFLSDTDICK